METPVKTRTRSHGLVGTVERPSYRLEVWLTDAPEKSAFEGDYLYLTKRHANGQIGERSIGLPIDDLAAVVAILKKTIKGN